ncbi:MAG: response regulator [Longimicrobiales bacterium]|nr:response regulator [Longimicrobiales bacterium]
MKKHFPDARLLIVDDEEANIQLLQRVLDPEGYGEIVTTTDPTEATTLLTEHDIDLVLLDLMMPEVDGFGVIEAIREVVPEEEYLPILVLTSDHSRDAERRALSGGAKDFLSKPLSPSEVRLRVRNLLETRFLHRALRNHNDLLERRVRERTADLEEARLQILLRLARAAEYRDDVTGEHTKRVGRRSGILARALDLPEGDVAMIELVAPLHDVGKIAIPDAILRKSTELTEAEFEIMKTHTDIGGDLLDDPNVPLLDVAARIARSHHEHWDGSGYPAGLAGDEIPLEGRIVAVADAYDALTHARPYKRAWSAEEALDEISREAGGHFDPDVVEVFGTLAKESRESVA